MKPIKLLYIFLCSSLFFQEPVLCQPVLEVNAGERSFAGKYLEYYIDTSKSLTIENVVTRRFSPCKNQILNLGIIQHPVWMKFSVQSKTEDELFLEIMAPLMERIEVYKIAGNVSEKVFTGGFTTPFYNRPVLTESWLLHLKEAKKGISTYYIKGYSGFNFQVPITVSSEARFIESNQLHNLFWGLYIGIMVFALLYNLFIYISVKELRYFYYILYVAGTSIFYLALQGFAFMFLWPGTPLLNKHIAVIICLTNIIITLFTMDFLKITRKNKGQYFSGWGIIGAFLLIAIINITGSYEVTTEPAQGMSLAIAVFCIYSGFVGLKEGNQSAKYFVLGWTIFSVLTIIFILTINNIIASNFFTTHCIFIGHMSEVLLLSFALADRINSLKKENEKFQKEIMKTQLEIQEQTFQNISQEIHDNIGQVLSLVKININSINAPIPDAVKEKLSDSKILLTKAIQDLRDLSKSLSTDFINQTGLENAIQQQLEILRKTGLYSTRFIIKGHTYKLSPQHELVVFRIVQELLNNIVKHAEATSINITMNYQADVLLISVQDNGKGFENGILQSFNNKGIGLYNIQNRVKLLKGLMNLESHNGDGSSVTLTLPK